MERGTRCVLFVTTYNIVKGYSSTCWFVALRQRALRAQKTPAQDAQRLPAAHALNVLTVPILSRPVRSLTWYAQQKVRFTHTRGVLSITN